MKPKGRQSVWGAERGWRESRHGVAPGLPAVGGADAEEQDKDGKGGAGLAEPSVALGRDGVDAEHEDEGGKELGQERGRPERGRERVGRKDAGGRSPADSRARLSVRDARYRPKASFVDVDLVLCAGAGADVVGWVSV